MGLHPNREAKHIGSEEIEKMIDMLLSEEGAPHPLVLAIIAIALTAICFGCGM